MNVPPPPPPPPPARPAQPSPSGPPRLLLVEPQFVLRRTIVTVARNLGVVDFQEANSLERARTLLIGEAFQALVMPLEPRSAALMLLNDLRLGKFLSRSDAPVIVVVEQALAEDEGHLRELAVTHLLRKPFKISELLKLIGEASL